MAFVPPLQPYRFTGEEYLAFERASAKRHEYLDGVIYAMAGESPDCGLDAALHLPGLGCTVSLADVYERVVFPSNMTEGREG